MKTHIKSSDVPVEEVANGLRRQIMGYDSDIMLVKVDFDTGGIGEPHTHPHQQVSYVVSGKFEVTINDKTEVLGPEDAFIVPSNVLHGAVCLEAGTLIDTFSPLREDFLEVK
jgi:quercetin dioxygenase-like cupin family protein